MLRKLKISLFLIPVILCSCSNRIDDEYPEGFDYIVGNDYSNLVKVTSKYGNIVGTIGDTYKVWYVPKGTA